MAHELAVVRAMRKTLSSGDVAELLGVSTASEQRLRKAENIATKKLVQVVFVDPAEQRLRKAENIATE